MSDAVVIAQICHIYAASDDGPRGKPGLTVAERNAPENLILMCGYHHPLVDKQYATYPTDLLKTWKRQHEAKFHQDTAEAVKLQDSMQQLAFLKAYSDRQIEAEIRAIRQGRFINGYPARQKATELSERIERTELAGGSNQIRAKGLAWCARLLCQPESLDRARELLEKSKALAETPESVLAEAFIIAGEDKDRALALLAPMNTAAARSAALRIVTNGEQAAGAIAWVERAGLSLASFDSEGKFFLISDELAAERWQEAADHAARIDDADFADTPVTGSSARTVFSLVRRKRDILSGADMPSASARRPCRSRSAEGRPAAGVTFTGVAGALQSRREPAGDDPQAPYRPTMASVWRSRSKRLRRWCHAPPARPARSSSSRL